MKMKTSIFKQFDYEKPYNIFIINDTIIGFKEDLNKKDHPLIFTKDLLGKLKRTFKENHTNIIHILTKKEKRISFITYNRT